ncbi:hypothetical protein GCM10027035_17170 [Emticicia sediminis]
MKRYHKKKKYKSHHLRKAKNNLKKTLRHKKWKRDKNRRLNSLNRYIRREFIRTGKIIDPFKEHEKIIAPTHLSMIENHSKVITFIKVIRDYFDEKKPVYIDLSEVTEVDFGGILVLLSIMIRFKAEGITISGCTPRNIRAKHILMESSFFYYLSRKFKDIDCYKVGISGDIYTVANRVVQSDLSAEIIKKASKSIWGEERRCPSVQRVFIELMHNTVDHAVLLEDTVAKEKRKHWWCTISCNRELNTVSFSFVDYGVGIFESLNSKKVESKWYEWRPKILRNRESDYSNNAELFKDMLEGVIHKTVTGEDFRGKGLPGIMETYRKGNIKKLSIITNDVYFNAETNIYKPLKNKFNGTFVYWEIDRSILSFKN